MASNKRNILVEVIGDFSRYTAGARKAGDSTGSFQDRVEKAGRAIALAYGAKQVVDFATAAVKAAADDAAAQQVLATTLKNTTGATKGQIAAVEDWITKTSHAYGFLDDKLRPALGDLLRATKDQTKAQELLTLAQDVSRGTGTDLETVTSAIAKAYTGNTTALARLVPGLKQAGDGTLTWADAQQRLNDQFKGHAAAYAETAAGKLERLNAEYQDMKETIGQALLPVFSQLVGIVTQLFGWFNSLNPQQQQFLTIVGLTAGALYVGVTAVNALTVAMSGLGITVESTMPWLLGISAAVGAVALALGLFGDDTEKTDEVQQQFAKSLRETADQADLQTVALLSTGEAAARYRSQLFAGLDKEMHDKIAGDKEMIAAMERYGITMGMVTDAGHDWANAGDLMAQASKDVTGATDAERRGLDKLIDLAWEYSGVSANSLDVNLRLARQGDITAISYLKQAGELSRLTPAEQEHALALLDEAAAADKAAGDVNQLTDVSGDLEAAQDDATTALYATRDALAEAGDAASDLKAAIDAVFAPYMDLEEATRNLQAGADDLTASFKKNGRTLDANTEKGRANREQVEQQVKGILDYGVASVNAGDSVEQAGNKVAFLTEGLKQQMRQAGFTDQQINDYLTSLGLTPENVTTSIELAQADTTKRQLEEQLGLLGDIDEGAKAEIQADLNNGDLEAARKKIDALKFGPDGKARKAPLVVSVSGGGTIDVSPRPGSRSLTVTAYAGGGDPKAGEFALVGEQGPELVQFGRASHVYPTTETSRILARDQTTGVTYLSVTVHNHGTVIAEKELTARLADAIRDASRRQGRDVLAARVVPI